MPKGLADLLILLGIAIFILIGGVVVYQKVLAPKVNPTPTSTISPSPTLTPTITTIPSSISQASPTPNSTANWKTYTDTIYQYMLKYPDDWVYQDRCEGGSSQNDHYPCFHSSDFSAGQAGVVMGGPTSGGEIIVSVSSEKSTQPLSFCLKNLNGYPFLCEQITVGSLTAWRSVIPKSSKQIPTYPISGNTIQVIFITGDKRYLIVGYFSDESKQKIIKLFDQILSTFKFLNSANNGYKCPSTEYVDCMPKIFPSGGQKELSFECTPEFLNWAKANCPNFKGALY